MAEVSKSKHIIEGFPEDFQKAQVEYAQCSRDYRLEDFFSYWRESQFNCLFANRFDPRELLESIVELNKKLVSHVTDDLSNQDTKLIALYFLLCIAAKQPPRLQRKIRLTCEDALLIQQLCSDVRQSKGHNDAEFCWFYLRRNNVIDFVEDKVIYGPSMLKNRIHTITEETVDTKESIPLGEAADEFIDSQLSPLMDDLRHFADQYKLIRDELKLDEAQDATVELDSDKSLTDLVDQAKDLLREYRASQSR